MTEVHNRHLIEYSKRGGIDNIPTPSKVAEDFATFFLEAYYNAYGKFPNIIWENAGTDDSAIAEAFRNLGINCICTDIKTGYNFLTTPTPPGVDAIVTNPPYSIKDKFIIEVIKRGLPFGLLVPVTALAGKSRNRYYKQLGNISLRVYSNRIDFTGKGNSWFNVMWLYWIPELPTRIDFVEI